MTPAEFQDNAWQGPEKEQLAPHLSKLAKRFNQVSFWVATEVVTAEDYGTSPSKTLRFFCKVLGHLRELCNFNGLMAVLAGLNNASVQVRHTLATRST